MNKQTKYKTESQRFAKLKEVQANAQSQRFCTTFNFAPTHPSPPTTQLLKQELNLEDYIEEITNGNLMLQELDIKKIWLSF
jgi:hypothetical protein